MSEQVRLNAHEARVLGVLVEKERTTPDQYPLSLHAIVMGCNQKSNRDPVTDYTEAEVVVALQGLTAKHLAGRSMPAGSRVEKHRHSARETLGLSEAECAVLAELMMRGAQQPGELRARASRMAAIATQADLQAALDALAQKGYVTNLGRRSGERAERWGQTLAPEAHPREAAPPAPESAQEPAAARPTAPAPEPDLSRRVAELEQRVATLERTLADLGA